MVTAKNVAVKETKELRFLVDKDGGGKLKDPASLNYVDCSDDVYVRLLFNKLLLARPESSINVPLGSYLVKDTTSTTFYLNHKRSHLTSRWLIWP